MKNFIEVTVFDNLKNDKKAIIPIENIACISEDDGCLRIYFKKGNLISLTVSQTFDQIAETLK